MPGAPPQTTGGPVDTNHPEPTQPFLATVAYTPRHYAARRLSARRLSLSPEDLAIRACFAAFLLIGGGLIGWGAFEIIKAVSE